MIKYVDPDGWDFGRPALVEIPISSRGLRGNDKKAFFKYASLDLMGPISQIEPHGDEVPVHLIALGASEYYSANRNGDGFKVATCKDCHPTFVKHAKWYRSHRNKGAQGDPWYGMVKASAYNDAMHRVELLCMLNAEKSACDRNGGFVADKELEKLGSAQSIAVSMACSIHHDQCSWCGNEAKTTANYCTGEKCAAGGCRDNLGRVVKMAGDLHTLHVDNPNPRWFDISNVWRPADRIAYATDAGEYFAKSASDDRHGASRRRVVGGAELAELDSAHEPLIFDDTPRDAEEKKKLGLLKGLAELEKASSHRSLSCYVSGAALVPRAAPPLPPYGSVQAASALIKLANAGIFLSPRQYESWSGKKLRVAADFFSGALRDPGASAILKLDPLADGCKYASAPSTLDAWIVRNSGDYSALVKYADARNLVGELRGARCERNTASTSSFGDGEREYAAYKIAAIIRCCGPDMCDLPSVALAAIASHKLN